MKLGVVLDQGSPDCKHQALGSMCGYEYCMNCSYKFVGHCARCHQRLLNTVDALKDFYKKLNGTR